MANDNMIATLEEWLRQARGRRARLSSRIVELSAELDATRTELDELNGLYSQTESSLQRLLSNAIQRSQMSNSAAGPSDLEIEAALRIDETRARYGSAAQQLLASRRRQFVEDVSERFRDRTIPQAVTMLLREAAGPLHVKDIYRKLLEGGFSFTGQNPTISIAVSLNRNARFRKVAPGTFDLVIREASKSAG
jgi:hypothetical protein